MQEKVKSILSGLLKALFAFGLIFWLIQSGKIDLKVFKVVLQPVFFSSCVLLVGLNLFLASERWRILLNHHGLSSGMFYTFKLTLIGIFFNFAIPGGVGGDVVKGYFLTQQHPEKKLDSILSVLMDRILGLYVMVAMAAFAMIFDLNQILQSKELSLIFYAIQSIFCIMTIALIVALSSRVKEANHINKLILKLPVPQKITHKFVEIYETIHGYSNDLKSIFKILAISFIGQSFSILMFMIIANAMGLHDFPKVVYFVAAPIAFIVTALPIAPAGVGVGQAAFYFLFNIFSGQETALGSTGITVLQVISFLFALIGAWFYISTKKEVKLETP